MGFFKQVFGHYQAFNDGTQDVPGIDRVQIGDLALYTDPDGQTSDAGPGIRVLDALGRLLFDALSLIGVMRTLGFAANGTSAATTGVTWVDVAGSQFTFTLKRPGRIDYRVHAAGKVTAGAAQGYVRGIIRKSADASTWDTTAAAIFGTIVSSGFMWYFAGPDAPSALLPAGVYTATVQISADAANTITLQQYFHHMILAGG